MTSNYDVNFSYQLKYFFSPFYKVVLIHMDIFWQLKVVDFLEHNYASLFFFLSILDTNMCDKYLFVESKNVCVFRKLSVLVVML